MTNAEISKRRAELKAELSCCRRDMKAVFAALETLYEDNELYLEAAKEKGYDHLVADFERTREKIKSQMSRLATMLMKSQGGVKQNSAKEIT